MLNPGTTPDERYMSVGGVPKLVVDLDESVHQVVGQPPLGAGNRR